MRQSIIVACSSFEDSTSLIRYQYLNTLILKLIKMNPIISWSLFTLSIATLFFGIISYVNTLNTHSWYIEYDRDEDYILLGFSIVIFLAITFILWKNNFYSRNK
jgi:hypothetical protein